MAAKVEKTKAEKSAKRVVQGHPVKDGAGVPLVRVLGIRTVQDFDPFLMLDAFDSHNPDEYAMGFPAHPHRGIETVTYLIEGVIEHKDHLGHRGTIHSGEAQWMTAGSGIVHEEMPQASPRLFGLQVWLNLPRKEKMTTPGYFDITGDMMKTVRDGEAEVRVIAGDFKGTRGVQPPHTHAAMLDVTLPAGGRIAIPVRAGDTAFAYLVDGSAIVAGQRIAARSAVLFGDGDEATVQATPDAGLRFLFFAAKPIGEPVAWGGPVVMNTDEELQAAFDELERGTFIKHKPTL